MKKINIFVLFLILFSISACGKEKDKSYFLDNRDKISIKIKNCEARIETAEKIKDEDKLLSALMDPECQAAKDAKKEVAALEYKRKRKAEEIERKRVENLIKKEIKNLHKHAEIDVIPLVNNLKELCKQDKNSIKCQAFHRESNYLIAKFISSKAKTISYDEARKKEKIASNKGCIFKKSNVDCMIDMNLASAVKKHDIDMLKNDKEKTRTEYNKCVDIYNSMNNVYDRRKAVSNYQCDIAKMAAKEIGLTNTHFNFREKI